MSMNDDAGSGIQGTGTSKERIKIRLRQRLRYSARLGEHLVEVSELRELRLLQELSWFRHTLLCPRPVIHIRCPFPDCRKVCPRH